MRTDVEIRDDVYEYIKNSPLAREVSGVVRKTIRPSKSKDEDIIISVLSNTNGQFQEAVVNVNIYFADIHREEEAEEDTIRCRELCKLSEEVLNVHATNRYIIRLENQRVYAVEGKEEHFINNRIRFKYFNY